MQRQVWGLMMLGMLAVPGASVLAVDGLELAAAPSAVLAVKEDKAVSDADDDDKPVVVPAALGDVIPTPAPTAAPVATPVVTPKPTAAPAPTATPKVEDPEEDETPRATPTPQPSPTPVPAPLSTTRPTAPLSTPSPTPAPTDAPGRGSLEETIDNATIGNVVAALGTAAAATAPSASATTPAAQPQTPSSIGTNLAFRALPALAPTISSIVPPKVVSAALQSQVLYPLRSGKTEYLYGLAGLLSIVGLAMVLAPRKRLS